MTERDERRERLRVEAQNNQDPSLHTFTSYLITELIASERDREALAEALELLRRAGSGDVSDDVNWQTRVLKLLKETEEVDV